MISPGVYFGLDEAAYHADPALGSTDIKALYLNPVQWQAKRLACGEGAEAPALAEILGLDTDEESLAKRFGRAVHCMVLEGPEAFAARNCVEPEKPEGLIGTIDEIKAAFRDGPVAVPEADTPMSKWKRDDWVKAARRMGVGPLTDDWAVQREAIIADREVISRRWQTTIRFIGGLLDTPRASLVGKSLRETVLSGGYPEVSIFWEDEGVRLKARVDYLRIKTSVDAKTFACPEGREIVDAFAGAVHRYGYDMQAAHYADARKAIPELFLAGRVYQGEGEEPTGEQLTFTRKVAAHAEADWVWLTIQTNGLPEIDLLDFARTGLVLASAQHMVREAKEAFAANTAKFGADSLWHIDRGLIRMEDAVFSPSITSRGARRWELPA